MIRPDQSPVMPAEDRDARQRAAIEDYIDKKLMAGVADIPMTRSGWHRENIEAVLKDYRDLGWIITGTGPWHFKKALRQPT